MRAAVVALVAGRENKARPMSPEQLGRIPELPALLTDGPGLCSDSVTSCDWRTHGIMGDVPDQGTLGDCWAWSALGALRAHVGIARQDTPIAALSAQEVVSCQTSACSCDTPTCTTDFADESDGGHPATAFEYIINHGGVSRLDAYPVIGDDHDFCGGRPSECKPDQQEKYATLVGIARVQSSVQAHEAALQHAGPVAVLIKADNLGIFGRSNWHEAAIFGRDVACTGSINHAVLMVGYGQDCSQGACVSYWVIRNSWGADWGDQGYFKVSYEADCGVTTGGSVLPTGSACPGCDEAVIV